MAIMDVEIANIDTTRKNFVSLCGVPCDSVNNTLIKYLEVLAI